jgi:type IV pilus assembly protein PilM
LGRRKTALIGLDIGPDAIKLLELAQKSGGYSVVSCAIEPLPEHAVADRQIVDPAAVAEAIERAVARSGTSARQAAVAVAGASVITKLVEMPEGLSDDDMEEQIRVEADQHIAFPIDEVSLDFEVLGPSSQHPQMVDVMLAACRREQVEQRSAAIELAGLKPLVVDVESLALENACALLAHQLPEQGRDKTVFLIDMGAQTTTFMALRNMKAVFTREEGFGDRQLVEDLARAYEINQDEASKRLRNDTLPDGDQNPVLAGFADDVAQQIDRSIKFYFSAVSQHDAVDMILLAGGCARIPGIEQRVQSLLSIPTRIASPFAQLSISARARRANAQRNEASLLIAAGLAMRAFDPER